MLLAYEELHGQGRKGFAPNILPLAGRGVEAFDHVDSAAPQQLHNAFESGAHYVAADARMATPQRCHGLHQPPLKLGEASCDRGLRNTSESRRRGERAFGRNGIRMHETWVAQGSMPSFRRQRFVNGRTSERAEEISGHREGE